MANVTPRLPDRTYKGKDADLAQKAAPSAYGAYGNLPPAKVRVTLPRTD